jgi:S1-C subfamily serine protease
MREKLKASIVRLLGAKRTVVGAGFLISEKELLTCAHVVAKALDVSKDTLELPKTEVYLNFPLVAPGNTLGARVIDWRPARPDTSIREDIAVLELTEDPPHGSCAARLTTAEALWGHHFRAFGFPAGYDTGVWASGVFRDEQADGWVQIEDVKQTGYFVKPGFSGTPVWDEQVNGVVGMVIAAERQDQVKAAFILPATLSSSKSS